ncbi:MAG: hypothetical protein M4579_002473 [Chaenotheca gracillima]|nr:MAG: hypothetical protein M4579_002473 [Chaenotheca gracillima]
MQYAIFAIAALGSCSFAAAAPVASQTPQVTLQVEFEAQGFRQETFDLNKLKTDLSFDTIADASVVFSSGVQTEAVACQAFADAEGIVKVGDLINTARTILAPDATLANPPTVKSVLCALKTTFEEQKSATPEAAGATARVQIALDSIDGAQQRVIAIGKKPTTVKLAGVNIKVVGAEKTDENKVTCQAFSDLDGKVSIGGKFTNKVGAFAQDLAQPKDFAVISCSA